MVLSSFTPPWLRGLALVAVLATVAGCGGGGGGGGPPIVPPPSSNADLSSLGVSAGTLTPSFAPAVLNYDVGPATLPATVTVTPTAADGDATIRVNGTPVASGAASQPIALGFGTTTVTIAVTAEDGTTTRTYRVDFDRTSAILTDLVVSAGPLVPGFDGGTLAYQAFCLPCGETTVTATAADPNVQITVEGTPTVSGVESAPVDLDAGTTTIDIQVTARDGTTQQTYVVEVDRSLAGQTAYIKASNTDGADAFASRVAISGDTMVVTAPFEASGATGIGGNQSDDGSLNAGAAYVFVRTGGVWTQQAYLKASNTDADDTFGISVDIDGDTIVIGAPQEDSNATGVNGSGSDDSAANSGAAYVFVRSGTTWTQQAYLKASNTDTEDRFGNAVAIDGDTILVGAPQEDSNATGVNGDQTDDSTEASGAVYVYTRSGTTWSQQAYLKASNTGTFDGFGETLDLDGNTAVIGAPFESSAATGVNGNQADNTLANAGAAYVFVRSGTTWSQQAYLKASATGFGDNFAQALAISGDTIAAGAPDEDSTASGIDGDDTDNTGSECGAVYVFVRNGTTWSQQAYVKASNPEDDDRFFTVALDGDVLAVGAPGEDSGASGLGGNQNDNSVTDAGAVYVFVRTGTAWSQLAYVKASNPGTEDQFGRVKAVAVEGQTLAVGAPFEDSSATGIDGDQTSNGAGDSGAAYVFE